jgi:SAM-dependent methyltransferase
VYDSFGHGEFPFDAFEEDAEWHTDPSLPQPTAYHGRAEIGSYFTRWIGAWKGLGAEAVHFEPRPGEQVVVTVRMGPDMDGIEPTVAHLWTLRQGKVVRVRVFGDRETALTAAAAPTPLRPAGRSLADRVWAAEREYRGAAPDTLVGFVRGLGAVGPALDLGCGDGRLSAELRTHQLTAADISLVALKRARRRVPDATIVLVEPGGRLPFDAETFELVLCADTIHEVQDVAQVVSEAKRVLVPGGVLAIATPAHSRRTGLRVLRQGFEAMFDPRKPALRFLTRRSLGELLDIAGFESIDIGEQDGELLATARR